MVIVEFEKLLKTGVLNGLTITDKLRFPTKKEAQNWIRDIQLFDRGVRYVRFNIKDVA